ncbi:hypothetical protein [Agrobacterium pusense]|uniref:hypothetical protein n=1 Tax=Agrobacterium pusense TaxID=648995 RepID=UPI000EE6BFDC|nr:hypothetical protein [Agrobacterium sp.]
MRHSKGIDLTRPPAPPYVENPKEVANLFEIANQLQDLSSWALIGGRCEREGWINRDWLEGKFPNAIISELSKTAVPQVRKSQKNRWILASHTAEI